MEIAKQLDGPAVIYHFLYHANTKQQTETAPDLQCAWCSIDCKALYSLLKHLKLCHPRFNVTYLVSVLSLFYMTKQNILKKKIL